MAAFYEDNFELSPQDALVYASVIYHLQENQPQQACFLNRNSKDFDNPDILQTLEGFNCKMISRFDRGHGYVRSQLTL